jgi:HlyD family secretion protein
MKTLVLIIAGGLAIGAFSLYGPGTWSEAKGADRFSSAVFEARHGDLQITVTENGYLKATKSENLQPKYDGQNTITWLIDEGSEVEEGDLLCEFDATNLENELEESQNRLIQYEAELEAAQANLSIQRRDNEAAIEKAELGLEVAKLELRRYNDGEYPNTMRKNLLAVEKAESELQRATEAFEQVPSLFEEGFLTSIQVEEERIRLREAQINLENAEKELELYETLTRPMELKQKEAKVRDAERDLETARQRAETNIKEKEARVSQHDRHVKSTKSRIEEHERDIGYMKMTAPRPGIVIYGDPKNTWMVNQIKLGNTIWQGVTVITLPDLSEMQVLINVHEADIDLLEVGQPCTITLDTYKGKVFKGEVTDVASVASSGRWGDQTNKQFKVEVSMADLDTELRSGITAKVEVLVEELENVLHVPIHAVFMDGEDFVCFQPDEGAFKRRTVEIGKRNAHYVVIESGLEPGEKVLLFDPREEEVGESAADEEGGGLTAPAASGAGDEAADA